MAGRLKAREAPAPQGCRPGRSPGWRDILVTLGCWAWFIFGFLFIFSWLYLGAALLGLCTAAGEAKKGEAEARFQRLNHWFYRIFFGLLSRLAPGQEIKIDPQAGRIPSGLVLANHLSYLDPLLLMALYPRHRSIVKSRFFRVPIFGWVLRRSGYLPDTAQGGQAGIMIEQLDSLAEFFRDQGKLFVFPEGTRSRDGRLGSIHSGALKIARLQGGPIHLLAISGTDRLFTPGRFWFSCSSANRIRVSYLGVIEWDREQPPGVTGLAAQIRQIYHQEAP
ncbi:lysophospholipid acyltransferase family protein [Desulfogranum mediterraneum]|uniref:lysophospholipid acyltransferase family protein n=1 Tax=Desulfogranum mediterraneum TaxID=160661 RepID=UPI000417C53F|nr:lysophospholipid acyltransferase family protein [Desulfogranum mediterraneum]